MGEVILTSVLVRVNILTLMYIDSLNVPTKPCPYMPTILKLSMVGGWPVLDLRPFVWSCVFIQ